MTLDLSKIPSFDSGMTCHKSQIPPFFSSFYACQVFILWLVQRNATAVVVVIELTHSGAGSRQINRSYGWSFVQRARQLLGDAVCVQVASEVTVFVLP